MNRKQSKKSRHGPVFNPAAGAATAGGPQLAVETTRSDVSALLSELEKRHRVNVPKGIHKEPALPEYRNRKPRWKK